MKNILQLVITLFLFTVTSFSSAATEKVSLQLKWKHQFQFAGYYMAIEKGFYKDAGLEVEIKEYFYDQDIVEEVLQGHSTFAVSGPGTLIDISKDKKIIYLAAIYQSSPLILLAAQRSNIKQIKDIKNLKVMLSGEHKIDAVLLAMMLSQGINYNDIQVQRHSYDVQDLININTDLMTSYISNEPYTLKEHGLDSLIFHPKDYGFDFYSDILFTSQEELKKHPERVRKFRQASLQGWEYAFEHIDETIELIIKKYNTQNKSRNALIYEANELKKLAFYHTDHIGKIKINALERMFETYRILGLVRGHIDFSKIIYSEEKNILALTEHEKNYLKKKGQLTMCIDPDWLPFSILENNDYKGISADIFKLIKEKLPVPVTIIPTSTWAQSLEYAQQRKCDIIDLAIQTAERKKYLKFTRPYLKVPLVIATRHDVPFIADFKSLDTEKVGIVAGYAFVEILRRSYPNINVIEVKSLRDGLQKVKDGKLFGYIGTLAGIAHVFKKDFTGELKITGKFSETWDMGSAVRNDDEQLFNILQKVFSSIDSQKIENIINKWITVKYEKQIDYTLTWQILVFVLFIIAFLIYRERALKKYNRVLEEQKELYNLVFENSSHAVLLLDTQTNKFIKCNTQTVKMLKASSKKEVIHMLPEDLSPKMQPDGQCSSKKSSQMIALSVQNHSHTFEWKHIKTTGEEFWVEITLTHILMNHREVIHVLWKNIDDQKEIERNLIESKEKAIAATLAKSEFLANMSHEIRTPMNGIIGMTHLALETESSIKQKRFLQTIDQSAKSLLGIINDILDFSKVEAGKLNIEKVNFDLKRLIDDVIRQITFKSKKKNIQVIVNYVSDINSKLYGDDLRLSQILTNLLDNAIKFTSVGAVTLSIWKINNNYLRFEVKDTGVGLSSKQQAKLFQSFSQADGSTTRKHGGTGLGLYISKSLVELMDGKIWVQSEPGKGSRFTFEIELHDIYEHSKITTRQAYNSESKLQIDPGDEFKQKKSLKHKLNKLSGKILLIEDNLINQEIITSLLEESHLIIDIANNGLEATNIFKQKQYNLIIMDIQMPIMDGYEATKIIRQTDPDIPIIALTANARQEDLEKTLQAGMNQHLNKPIEIDKLYKILIKYLPKDEISKASTSIKTAKASTSPDIPEFSNINTELGLSYFSGNSKIYLKILKKFSEGYKDLKVEDLNLEQLKRCAHTVRGLSSNIGATELNDITVKLDEKQNVELIQAFAKSLSQVISEIDKNLNF